MRYDSAGPIYSPPLTSHRTATSVSMLHQRALRSPSVPSSASAMASTSSPATTQPSATLRCSPPPSSTLSAASSQGAGTSASSSRAVTSSRRAASRSDRSTMRSRSSRRCLQPRGLLTEQRCRLSASQTARRGAACLPSPPCSSGMPATSWGRRGTSPSSSTRRRRTWTSSSRTGTSSAGPWGRTTRGGCAPVSATAVRI